jgi:hypothetical protein
MDFVGSGVGPVAVVPFVDIWDLVCVSMDFLFPDRVRSIWYSR